MLAPETVTRDEDGDWTHPALMDLMVSGGELREIVPDDEWNAWLAEHNIEFQVSAMEYDLEPEHPAYIRHFEDGNTGSVGWEPSPQGLSGACSVFMTPRTALWLSGTERYPM